jgi:hypothetical protein
MLNRWNPFFISMSLVLFAIQQANEKETQKKEIKPNVVFIICDDYQEFFLSSSPSQNYEHG